jgi:hypothetical protein
MLLIQTTDSFISIVYYNKNLFAHAAWLIADETAKRQVWHDYSKSFRVTYMPHEERNRLSLAGPIVMRFSEVAFRDFVGHAFALVATKTVVSFASKQANDTSKEDPTSNRIEEMRI